MAVSRYTADIADRRLQPFSINIFKRWTAIKPPVAAVALANSCETFSIVISLRCSEGVFITSAYVSHGIQAVKKYRSYSLMLNERPHRFKISSTGTSQPGF